jgi:hypothetical protein
VKGHLALDTFPAAPSEIRFLQAGEIKGSASVASDGGFSLTIPEGKAYVLEIGTADSSPGVVFPRQTGHIDALFDVRASGGTFDLGSIRYVGAPGLQTFAFVASAAADPDNVECEDGIDANTGAVCVDDDTKDEGGACEDDGNEGENSTEANTVECDNGIDANTGAPCVDAEVIDPLPSEAAVAEHNLPEALGCDVEQEGEHEG